MSTAQVPDRGEARRHRARGLLALALLAGAVAAHAAEPVEVLRGIPHQALFGIDMDGPHGIAVGAGGQIMVTADAGKHWTPEQAPGLLSLTDVATRNGRSVAVGQMGLILRRDSAGAWQPVTSGTIERLLSVDMNRSGLAVAVGSFGTVLRSEDGGASWRDVSPDWTAMFADDSATLGDSFAPHVYGVKVTDGGTVVIAGELSLVLISRAAGTPWIVANRGAVSEGRVEPSLFGLDIRDDGLGFAVGQSGRVLKTVNGGASWRVVDSDSETILLGVSVGADQRVLVTGMREMLASSDSGDSWSHVKGADVTTSWYSAVARQGASFFVVGQSGAILSVSR